MHALGEECYDLEQYAACAEIYIVVVYGYIGKFQQFFEKFFAVCALKKSNAGQAVFLQDLGKKVALKIDPDFLKRCVF